MSAICWCGRDLLVIGRTTMHYECPKHGLLYESSDTPTPPPKSKWVGEDSYDPPTSGKSEGQNNAG